MVMRDMSGRRGKAYALSGGLYAEKRVMSVLLEGDHEVPMGDGAEGYAVAAADALGLAAVDLMRTANEPHASVLKGLWLVFDDADHGVAAALEIDGLVKVFRREVDGEALGRGPANGELIKAVGLVMGVSPSCAQVRRGFGEQPEQGAIDAPGLMPEVTADVVAEKAGRRQRGDLLDELLGRDASFFACNCVAVKASVVALHGVADLASTAGWRARGPAGGADSNGARLLVM